MTQKLEKEIQELLEKYVNPDTLIEISNRLLKIIDNNTSIKQVEEFMLTFNQKVRTSPQIPTKEECDFRLELCTEELIEIAEACGSEVLSAFGRKLFHKSQEIHYKVEQNRENIKPNLIALLDGLEDQQYVLDGFKITCGTQSMSKDLFDEIHESNMSKACITQEEAQATTDKYNSEGIPVTFSPKMLDGKVIYLITRNSDNKILKSINYKPADLLKVFPVGNSPG